MDPVVPIEITVNGSTHRVEVPPQLTLLGLIRDRLQLTGTKSCCQVGECGACTVIMDGRAVDSCLVLAVEADRADVTTVEGLADGGRLSPLQEEFLHTGAVQCGYCTPGQLMAASELLGQTPHPSRDQVLEALSGNLCRCGCYYQITEAVLAAAER